MMGWILRFLRKLCEALSSMALSLIRTDFDTGGMHLERYRPGSPLPGANLKRVLHGLTAARHSMNAGELIAGLAWWG